MSQGSGMSEAKTRFYLADGSIEHCEMLGLPMFEAGDTFGHRCKDGELRVFYARSFNVGASAHPVAGLKSFSRTWWAFVEEGAEKEAEHGEATESLRLLGEHGYPFGTFYPPIKELSNVYGEATVKAPAPNVVGMITSDGKVAALGDVTFAATVFRIQGVACECGSRLMALPTDLFVYCLNCGSTVDVPDVRENEWKPSYLKRALLTTPWSAGLHQARPCPECGKAWMPWCGSRLPCHARCLLNMEGVEHCIRYFHEASGGISTIAKEIGVTVGVVRSTLHANGFTMR